MKIMKNNHKGFTLIELMITVAIIAILAAIAMPSFSSYILKSHRIDAKDALTSVQFAEEKYRANQTTYTNNLADLGLSNTTQQKYYTVSLTIAGTGYVGMASITGSQAKDTECPNLVVTERGFVTDKSYTVGGVLVDTTSSTYKKCWG